MDKSQKNIEAFKSDVDHFRDGAEQNDDFTILAIRINKAAISAYSVLS